MEKNAKKKKTLLIVGIVVAVLVVVYIICIATGNVKPAESFSNNQTSSNMTNESSSIKTTEIIWKDEKKYGIANLYLDGTKTKEAIVLSYYKEEIRRASCRERV